MFLSLYKYDINIYISYLDCSNNLDLRAAI